jgi:GDP/UDP-N,N'-diacetylbacillosamine 2-epimerase (hydrolysing)
MKKKIAVLTATRAEYGLLKNIISALNQIDEIDVEVVVTGAHLSPEYGFTYREIEKDGIHITKKIEILLSSSTAVAVSKSMGLALASFAEYFEESKPDALLVLGDRYETLAVCCAAMNARLPIFHMYGGETTEGAIDEAVRHAVTKMSYLHFTSTEEYRRRVIQMGENPARVFHVGAVGVENALHRKKLRKEELAESVGIDLKVPFGVVTFHPVTLESGVETQCRELLGAMEYFSDFQFIITGANADCGGTAVNQMLSEFASQHENVYFTLSLGAERYLSALNYASFVLGNSSSGLVEVPSFHIPTINIGNRQKGRIKADSVLDCEANAKDIIRAVEYALSESFLECVKNVENPYGDGNTSKRVVEIIKEHILHNELSLQKKFYDINF